ncbi:MAG: trigger factor [Bacteroidales bacterium]|jgi:trigger factor|nr:trigger factor [Bacteroidales bacterium]
MNINKEQIDDVNVVVSVGISKNDYASKVTEILRDYRRKATMPGFRPGKVPEGLVRKAYGKIVLVDEINKLVAESLQKYIKEQELHVLGDPMPKETGDLEWEIGNDFTFDFEIGLAPVIDINLSKEDRITQYRVTVDQELIDRDVENYAARYGQFVDVDAVADFKERLTGDIVQLGEDGQPLQDGLSAEDTSLTVMLIKDEEHKKPFENARAGDEIVFNLSETFPNDWEIASILKKRTKEEVGDISASLFRFTVKSIQKFVNAELNRELFDKVYGKGTVADLEEFENRIRDKIVSDFEESCMSKFGNDAREYLLEKFNPKLPEKFLHKWLLATNKEVNEDAFEKEFPMLLKNMKWELIAKAIAKQSEMKVTEQEIINMAKAIAYQQFSMYGMSHVSDETLTDYAMNSLKNEESVRGIALRAFERKIARIVNEAVDVSIQELSLDDFNKMVRASNNEETKEPGETEDLE